MSKENLKIVIADDHPLLLAGVVSVLQKELENVIIHEAINGAEALQKVIEVEPDITILDIEMPFLNGVEVAQKILASDLNTKIIFLTLHKERSLFNEIKEMGIDGYILKEFSTDEITQCVNAVLAGKKYYSKKVEGFIEKPGFDLSIFTKTEINIIKLISKEKTTKEIAEMLFVSPNTIESHRYNICKKLELKPEKNSLMKWVFQNAAHF